MTRPRKDQSYVGVKHTLKKGPPAIPKPSSSVILVSPQNHVLLLHRVKTSTSFAAAHVFPGGNVDAFHDGEMPSPEDASRHQDIEPYRLAAIRETFEESGIVLAKNNGFGRLIEVDEKERDEGRKKVHGREVQFQRWLAAKGGRADVDGLIPFTRWITPTNVPKRFTTQMYIYMLPLSNSSNSNPLGADDVESEAMIPTPTPDGGIEHTAARFLPPSTWIRLAKEGRIILFPPQFFILHLISQFLSPDSPSIGTPLPPFEEMQRRRQQLLEFVKTSDPPWGEKCISPSVVALPSGKRKDGRQILGLDKAGAEVGATRRGDSEHVVLVDFKKEGPRRLDVRLKKDVLAESREESKL